MVEPVDSVALGGLELSPLNVTLSAAPIGAEICGFDLARTVDDAALRQVVDVFHDRGVIVFRDQHLTPEQQIAFSRRLGELEIHVAADYLLPGFPEILVVSNIVENGRNIGLADAGQYWHSDLSYVAVPSRCSLLYAIEVPREAERVLGETLFASAAHAYEGLADSMKRRLDGLRAVHRYGDRYRKQQAAGGRGGLTDEQLRRVPDVVHPVVRAHPLTGRKVLFVNEGFTVEIEGMTREAGTALLEELFAHATRAEYIYGHEWREGDVLMWDNCLVQHRAIRNYELPLRRLMHRTTVRGATG